MICLGLIVRGDGGLSAPVLCLSGPISAKTYDGCPSLGQPPSAYFKDT